MDRARLGHFDLLDQIGEGGMGRVYKARDTRLERLVAIKLLPESKVADAERRARFVQEAKAASALNHPNIITIYEIGEQDGQTFIVMELVDGQPLNELIGRKTLRLKETLRIATQVADALAAAHKAGIVHRDLKPANIMVDAQGRAKLLDFGLAKLAPAGPASAEGTTQTVVRHRSLTEEGAILGSVPYMSPEQAEGKPVDARSDIFSFGAVLYEMVTGQRAFRGESRASTLAAVVEKDPPPPSDINRDTPPELERLITRCLRKDVHRRSQHMADVKLALEELRDDSESGKLGRAVTSLPEAATGRRWLWPAVAGTSVAIAAAIVWSSWHRSSGTESAGPDLVRLSPDDGHVYGEPSISPDGKFVAYVSDRSGRNELWLQQVGGGDPIQLTHAGISHDPPPSFFPDGTRILYTTGDPFGGGGNLEVIPTLGGEPRVLIRDRNFTPAGLSPDGRQIAYSTYEGHLMVMSSEGGPPRELSNWSRLGNDAELWGWTPDGRHLFCSASRRPQAPKIEEWEWWVLPVDGGDPVATGAGDAVRAAGLTWAFPLPVGDRVLFAGRKGDRNNVWEIRLSPDSWRVRTAPRQLTFGTEDESVSSVSAAGLAALDVQMNYSDLYLFPLDPMSGQPTGAVRRLTQDRRRKLLLGGGNPGSVLFFVFSQNRSQYADDYYALDLASGKQTLVIPKLSLESTPRVSRDGRQIAYSVVEGGVDSIRMGDAGADPGQARAVCSKCGRPIGFSPDGRFLLYVPEAQVNPGPQTRQTVRLLDAASGKDTPWLEHPTDSIQSWLLSAFGEDGTWFVISVRPPGLPQGAVRQYIVPWRAEPVPPSEWIELKLLGEHEWTPAPAGNVLYVFQGSTIMAARFDPKSRRVSEPFEVTFTPGSPVTVKPDDDWEIRGPGLVFGRLQRTNSIWLMPLPK